MCSRRYSRNIPIIRAWCITSFMPAIRPRWRTTDLQPRSTTERSPRPRRTPSICRVTFSRDWECGRPTSMRMWARWPRRMRRRAENRAAPWINSIRMISWCTPTCRAVKKLGPKPCSTIRPRRLRTSRPCRIWASTVAAGHLRQPQQARDNLAGYDALMAKIKQGRHAYFADSTGGRIERAEMLAWIAFAADDSADALKHMQEAADLQDKVGQGEVDIPAREMLADILLGLRRPQEALLESPCRALHHAAQRGVDYHVHAGGNAGGGPVA